MPSIQWSPRSKKAVLLAAAQELGHDVKSSTHTKAQLLALLQSGEPSESDEIAEVSEPDRPLQAAAAITVDSYKEVSESFRRSRPLIPPAPSEADERERVRVEVTRGAERSTGIVTPDELDELLAKAREAKGVKVAVARVAKVGDTVCMWADSRSARVLDVRDDESALVEYAPGIVGVVDLAECVVAKPKEPAKPQPQRPAPVGEHRERKVDFVI